MSKRAIILAGGKGTRLRPYTIVLPKPLMPIGEYPVLEVIVRQLARNGFSRITMAVNHQAEIVKAFFSDGAKWGIKIDYSLEDKPLSTMAPLKLISDLPEDFLVMNGDILTNLNYSEFYDYHVKNRNIFTVSACRRQEKSEYGVLEADEHNKLTGFKEKPEVSRLVSMGIYMANKKILELISGNEPYGFDNLMYDLIRIKNPASIKAFDGHWLDIGRSDDYIKAIDEFEKLKKVFLPND